MRVREGEEEHRDASGGGGGGSQDQAKYFLQSEKV
jgi:hypothetical protein